MSQKKDLTRIEDLSEFIHEENDELDSKLDSFSFDTPNTEDEDTPPLVDFELSETNETSETDIPVMDESAPLDFTDNFESNFSLTESENSDIPNLDFSANEESLPDFETPTTEEIVENVPDTTFEDDVAETTYKDKSNVAAIQFLKNENAANEEMLKNGDFLENQAHQNKDIEEIRNFGENLQVTQAETGFNPPFSLLIRNIRYIEHGDEIIRLLGEYQILNEQNKKAFLTAIDYGQILITQISEFVCVKLIIGLKQLGLDFEAMPSDLANKSDKAQSNKGALAPKSTPNKYLSSSFAKRSSEDKSIHDIILTTTEKIQNKDIVEYMGIINHSLVIDQEHMRSISEIEGKDFDIDNYEKEILQHNFYQDLNTELKNAAHKKGADAIIGIVYQAIPIYQLGQTFKLKLLATGNLVRII